MMAPLNFVSFQILFFLLSLILCCNDFFYKTFISVVFKLFQKLLFSLYSSQSLYLSLRLTLQHVPNMVTAQTSFYQALWPRPLTSVTHHLSDHTLFQCETISRSCGHSNPSRSCWAVVYHIPCRSIPPEGKQTWNLTHIRLLFGIM